MSGMLSKIQDKLNQHSEIKVISFDIFDTILFRMVCKPVDVFEIVGEKAIEKGYLSEYISPVIYRNLRIEAERKARVIKKKKCKSTEVTLDEIIEALPDYCCNKKELLLLELKTEQDVCWLNPDIYDVMDFLGKHKEYKVILTSDMYLTQRQLKNILVNNGLVTDIFEKIFVSCEHRADKKSGTLFEEIIKEMNIEPNELLHIGDNFQSDMASASNVGINTVLYDVISSDTYTEFVMENIKYGRLCKELYALRKYTVQKGDDYEGEKKEWFRFGAMIMGPLMTGVSEWVLDIAEKEKVNNIYPLMREGMIISRLLKQANEYRKNDVCVQPMYVSRKALFLPGIKIWNEDNYDKIYEIKQGTIGAVLDMFGLSDAELDKYREINLVDCGKIKIGNVLLTDYLRQYLLSKSVSEKIQNIIDKECEKFDKYLERLNVNGRFITIDLGMKGTMQEALSKYLRKESEYQDIIHLLIFGNYKNIYKLMDNIDIRGYAGSSGSNEDITFEVAKKPHIWEQLLMCDKGTTIAYGEDGTPITQNIDGIGKEQFEKISCCQEGMLYFQKEYLKLQKRKGIRINISPVEAAKIPMRVVNFPLEKEADMIGNICFDENFGMNTVKKMCPDEFIERVKQIGAAEFIENIVPGDVPWIEGVITRVCPAYYIDRVFEQRLSEYEYSVYKIVKQVVSNNIKNVVVSGAGEMGRMMKRFLSIYNINVEAFTDGNPKMQGNIIEGIPIKSVKDNFNTKHFIIASFAYAEEIEEQLRWYQGKDVLVYKCDKKI